MQRDVPLAVECARLTRRFGDVLVLNAIDLQIRQGEFFSLLGPSGCGKTTLLRIIAGLDFPDDGGLRLHGRDAAAIPAQQRSVNTVFQSYALFPHMAVRNNVAFGLKMKKVPADETARRVSSIMELTRISALAERRPSQLSGGQKQRVALARALVNEPQVLLLDEPLGALDLKLRKELQQELRSVQRRTGVTFVYVTHDQDEALSMSDRVAVMDHGRIVQVGAPQELYERPRTRFVAEFLGGCNLIPVEVQQRSGEMLVAQSSLGELHIRSNDPRRGFTVAIRPEKVQLTGGPNQLAAEIVETTYTGAETLCVAAIRGERLRITTVNAAQAPRLQTGMRVQVSLPPDALIVLED